MARDNFWTILQEHVSGGCPSEITEIETGRRASYKEMYGQALSWRSHFAKFRGKVVSLVLPNSIDYLAGFFAVNSTGNIYNPIPYFVSIQELNRIFEYVRPEAVLTDRDDVIKGYGGALKVMDTREMCSMGGSVGEEGFSGDDIASLYYSSGTTGNPKGVLYSNRNMVSLIGSIVRGFKFDSSVSHLAFLPFGHTASINYNILPAIFCGAPLFISQGFEHLRTSFFMRLSDYDIGYTEVVPTVVFMLNKLKLKTDGLSFEKLRFIGCGSSTLPLTSQIEFMENYGIRLANLYGLSETGPSHIDDPLEAGWEPGSIGVPLDVNECRIADDGEILLKGENVFVGYHGNPSLYSEVVVDGWFHTGDLGYEKGGRFYFVDRKKDLIIKGGINIVPMEVEEILYKHPDVHECVVVGQDNDLYGEEVVAVVVCRDHEDGASLGRELKALCKSELSNYKVPSRILFWRELPKTHSNKILRRKVREAVNIGRLKETI